MLRGVCGISDPPTQAEELTDDLRPLSTLIHSLRTATRPRGWLRVGRWTLTS